ncbi:MAG TPA: flagellar basal body P-ring formation chaperone FlgA [Blastocatellia bacterium]|nr:flagellar basal body P-ring formation chaperone FlgA [Blastocatellia bacterium]
MKIAAATIWLALCLGLVSSSFAQANLPVVRVAAETTALQDRLTLGDVAEVRATDATVVARLRAVSLGYAPNVGMTREIARDRIALAIAAAGFAPGTVQVEAPAVALIRRAAQIVDPALLREAIEHATLDGLNASGATARLARLELPTNIEAPAGHLDIRAATGQARDVFAPFTVFIELWQEGRVVKRLTATAQVEAFAPVLVTAREIAANTRLRYESYRMEVKRLERPLSYYITDPERLRGTAVRRAMARGEAITTDVISAEIVVRPGDPVKIIGQSGALQLMVAGEARAAGRIGDRIQVKNLQSGALLQAIVADEGVVRIRF